MADKVARTKSFAVEYIEKWNLVEKRRLVR